MAPRPQTFASHRRIYPLFHYAFWLLLANVGVQLYLLVRAPSGAAAWSLVMWGAVAAAVGSARRMATVVQNRIIRLEMRLRLAQVLPPELRNRVGDLRERQLIALRFAPDAELPELVQRCLAGDLTRSDEIKREIRDWQPDFLRV